MRYRRPGLDGLTHLLLIIGADTGASATTTTYEGTLPCRSCDGIDLTVNLSGSESSPAPERTFTLEADYINHPQNPGPEQYQGQWDVMTGTATDPKATVYELTPNGEGQIYYFQKIDPNTLELIDPQRRQIGRASCRERV